MSTPPSRPPERPVDRVTLAQRARALAGRTVAELAQRHGYRVPRDLRMHKGYVGQLVEIALGADAGSESRPDFTGLGVELKTIPIRDDGAPLGSTFVCKATIDGSEPWDFKETALWHKLADVLFVPVQGDAAIPLAARRFGMPFTWQPDAEDSAALEADWRLLTEKIRQSGVDAVTAHEGEILQLRPKAASSLERSPGLSSEGWLIPTAPRGWYLRRSFTATLIARVFGGTPT